MWLIILIEVSGAIIVIKGLAEQDLFFVIWGAICIAIPIVIYFQVKHDHESGNYDRKIAQEKREAEESQRDPTPWRVRYATYPCPHCGHYKVRSAKWEDKKLSVAFWGPMSSALGKEFKCENCGRMW